MNESDRKEQWRDRLIEIKSLRAGELLDHPKNPKIHPDGQKAPLEGLLREVGKVDILRAYYSERSGGQLTLWDGHCRRELRPDEIWQVGIYDLTDAEADLLLASFDPIGWQAEQSRQKLESLLSEINTGEAALQQMLSDLAAQQGIYAAAPGDKPDVNYDEHWQGMPEFETHPKAHRSLLVHFETAEDVRDFEQKIGQSLLEKTKYVWHPKKERQDLKDTYYESPEE